MILFSFWCRVICKTQKVIGRHIEKNAYPYTYFNSYAYYATGVAGSGYTVSSDFTDGYAVCSLSKSSNFALRVYNPESNINIYKNTPFYFWIDMYITVDGTTPLALGFLLNWFRIGNIGSTYAGVLRDFLRFTKDVPDGSHYDRVNICRWWDEFIGELGKCSQMYIVGGDYSLEKVRYFLESQCASSLKLFLQVNNGDFDDLIDIIDHARLNSRQKQLLDKIQSMRLE